MPIALEIAPQPMAIPRAGWLETDPEIEWGPAMKTIEEMTGRDRLLVLWGVMWRMVLWITAVAVTVSWIGEERLRHYGQAFARWLGI